MIKDVLEDLCMLSGQKISLNKSKVFFSPNVSKSHATFLSKKCGVTLTDDLGKYLGVPILHKRHSKEHFKFIIEKIQNKLNGWKAKSLSLAGRTTLVKAVTSTILNHVMQTNWLPQATCDQIDKLNRNFLWGDTLTKRKSSL